MYTVVFAAIVVAVCKSNGLVNDPRIKVNVCEDAEVLHTAILVTTVVVDAGTVYSVVALVAAAPL
jgi:hypothetical protein